MDERRMMREGVQEVDFNAALANVMTENPEEQYLRNYLNKKKKHKKKKKAKK